MSNVKPDWRLITRHPAYFVAFGFGSGLSPWGPGTLGTLVAYPLYFLLQWAGVTCGWLALLCLPLFVAGVKICDMADAVLGTHDHSGVNFDEIVAMLLVLAFVPATLSALIAAFVAFRVFDIVKPWPIGWLDRRVKGGFGVMIDDILAAAMALAVLRAAMAAGWL
ncbi:phosphatidylglycerophosphatase A family protein [Paludibacterium paludis]|uniref:phosphatidylglycerophosphatase A family protein n=1 Tax=Paludibacterium paludis TaxID=1225769 RepID=UPI001673A1E9|nr:phosphatidylglycerophosphatase A [Paludibacterium paludis]